MIGNVQVSNNKGHFVSLAALPQFDFVGELPLLYRTYVPSASLDSGSIRKGQFVVSERSLTYKKHWQELINYYGSRCFYCRKEVATTIDHVVPYSYDQDNDIENLVPACALCNALASNKMFDSVEHKRQYILTQRQKRRNQSLICSDCLLPYAYRIHSPSLILCAECYDEEYDTGFSHTKEWRKWLGQLRLAGIPAEAHRAMKKRMTKGAKDYSAKLELLIDEYSYIVDTDEEFAEMLIAV